MTNQFNGLVCVACGGELDLEIGYTGADWDSEAGEGSGFFYEVQLCCNKFGCGRVYKVGYLKNENAISPPKKS